MGPRPNIINSLRRSLIAASACLAVAAAVPPAASHAKANVASDTGPLATTKSYLTYQPVIVTPTLYYAYLPTPRP